MGADSVPPCVQTDDDHGVGYIPCRDLSDAVTVLRSVTSPDETVVLDFDGNGDLIGVEILDLSIFGDRPPASPPLVPSLVAVADLVRGDRVALNRTGEAPVSMSRSWATVTDVVQLAGRQPLLMVLTDAATRSRRTLRPEVQVWAMRPATGTDAEAAA